MMYEFKFPDVGEGVHEGNILQLKATPGDMVEAGDILAVVETDKVVAEIPSSKDGKLVKFGFEEGQVIEVGQTLAYIEIEGDDAGEEPPKTMQVVEENANVVGELELSDGSVLPASGEGMSDSSHENASLLDSTRAQKVLATPLARKLAKDKGIDLSKVIGTGPAGRVTKKDIMSFSGDVETKAQKVETPAAPKATVTRSEEDRVIPMSKLRETIARNMTISSQIPTATVHEEIDFDAIVEMRKSINEGSDERISYLPIIVKALTLALKKFPAFNSTYDPEKKEITVHGDINVGIAMDSGSGLFVPVINQTQGLTVGDISTQVKHYVGKVKENSIAIGDMRGGTFTVSNYGTAGGLFANPLILPPQVAIMGLGRVHQRPVVKNGEIVPGYVLPVSLVIDHRVLDGTPAGQFLSYFRDLLENPHKLMMSMV